MQGENLDLGLQTVCTVSMSKEAANSAICASEREASSIASITSIGSRNPGERERTVPSSSGSGVVAVVHETGERKSAMELEALVMVNHCFHPHKLYKLYKFIGKE